MKIDLHIHSKYSDGKMNVGEIYQEARKRDVGIISITDHDSIDSQEEAKALADEYDIQYLYGLELSVSFSHEAYPDLKPISLDFLAYQYDINNKPLIKKLKGLREYREKRAKLILENINRELSREDIDVLDENDLLAIEDSVDGAFGRPHIADYLVKKEITKTRKEAFDRFLIKCNVPKMPLSLPEASALIKNAGGKLILAHPNHPRGTSLIKYSQDLEKQQAIIRETMMSYIDGIECWHSEHDDKSILSYLNFARQMGLMVTGGSDCHQQPVLIGSVDIPTEIIRQFAQP
ncbi:PHP domain-containing protein [bacterium]|nr:PHP domain-containing protein [bacterium]